MIPGIQDIIKLLRGHFYAKIIPAYSFMDRFWMKICSNANIKKEFFFYEIIYDLKCHFWRNFVINLL